MHNPLTCPACWALGVAWTAIFAYALLVLLVLK